MRKLYRVRFWSYQYTDVLANSKNEAIDLAEERAEKHGNLADSSADGCIGWANITADVIVEWRKKGAK